MNNDWLYKTPVNESNGAETTLAKYKDNVLLIVNVASRCGFTPQYKGLQELHDKYSSKGFSVIAFPCNQFAGQEPGNEEEIRSFCTLNYGVTFPIFAKIEVNGANAHPLYQKLKAASPGLLGTEAIKWNFTKFLVNRKGEILKRYAPSTTPQALEDDVLAALA